MTTFNRFWTYFFYCLFSNYFTLSSLIQKVSCLPQEAEHKDHDHDHEGEEHHEDEIKPTSTTNSTTTATSAEEAVSAEKVRQNVGLAWGLIIICIIASCIGAFVPFLQNTRFGKRIGIGSPSFLAGTLGFGAGILLLLALTELIPEAIESFKDTPNFPQQHVTLVTTCIFFFPILAGLIVQYVRILKNTKQGSGLKSSSKSMKKISSSSSEENTTLSSHDLEAQKNNSEYVDAEKLDRLEIESEDQKTIASFESESTQLKRTAWEICLALAFHNFPEAVIIMALALGNAGLGALYAIGSIIHRLPEGALISVPMYAATGSTWKALGATFLAGGLSQLVGAIVGYFVYVNYWNPAISGTLYALVAGILVFSTISNALPRAFRIHVSTLVISRAFFGGVILFYIAHIILSYTEAGHSH